MASLIARQSQRPISPRETTWIGCAFLLACLPHLDRMPWWIAGMVGLMAGWRLYLARRNAEPPGRWLLILLAAVATVGVLIQYRTVLGREAGVTLLVLMLALKLLETRSQRDGILMGFLGCFLLVTNFLYSQTITTALYMLFCAWMMITALIVLQYTGRWPGWRHPLRRSATLLAQAVPLMLVLFFLFPRIQGPLWGLPHDAYAGLTGLSDTMSPGSLNGLIISDAVAFRAEFKGRIPDAKSLYWRGPVLWDYDGRTWTAPSAVGAIHDYPESGNALEYLVTVEPHNKRWLFALEFPGQRPSQSYLTHDMQLLSTRPVRNRLRYEMTSYPQARYGLEDSEYILRRNRALPAGSNPRTQAFAQELRNRYNDDADLINFVLQKFRSENFVYTLSPPLLGEHPVDDFLFTTRRGFCEHYSSAFTVLMRAAGIPARVVTGYQGGEINPVGEYVLVRQADAHAWVEVWLENQGWLRIDPTAAVSPARVERGIATALPRSDPLPMFVRGDYQFLQRMRLTWDSVTYTWNQWVLGYNPERQRRFFNTLGFSETTWQVFAALLIGFSGLALLIGAILALRELQRLREEPALKLYRRFCALLARKGCPRAPHEGPQDYAQRAATALPALAKAIRETGRIYTALRYGRQPPPDLIKQLDAAIRALQRG